MTGRTSACQPSAAPGTEIAAAAQRYQIAICGAFLRSISAAAAERTFRRWRQSPDVLVRGDLRTGFVWVWPDHRTRIEIVPERDHGAGLADSAAASADADAGGAESGVVTA